MSRVNLARRIWGKVGRFAKLPLGETWWLLKAWRSISRIDRALRTETGRRRLLTEPPEPELRHSNSLQPERIADLVEIAARHHTVRARCLHRSICLQHLLAEAGYRADLKVGVRKDRVNADGEFPEAIGIDAHAWVEIDGRAIGEDAPSGRDYRTLGSVRNPP